jgi:hypothetical protein
MAYTGAYTYQYASFISIPVFSNQVFRKAATMQVYGSYGKGITTE